MNQAIQVPPFTLYGLLGCPHCAQAEQYLRVRGIPVNLVVANEDPIADAGVKAILNESQAQYPVLVNRISKSIQKGFDEGKFRELTDSYFALAGAGAPNFFGGGQLAQSENPVQTEAPSTPNGAN